MISKKTMAVLALILTAVLALTSCGGGAQPSASSTAPASSAKPASPAPAPSAAPSSAAPSDGLSGVNEFPFVKEKTTFIIATPYYPYIIDYDTNEQTLHLEEKTGLDIVWDILPEQNSQEKINLMFAAGTGMPDAFSNCEATFTANMQATLGSQGLIAPLGELMDKWGHYIAQWREKFPNAIPQLTATDGKIYSLPQISRNEANTYAQRFWVNKNFMEALGITKLPETTEEYYQYLKAVKEGDPNKNGKQDEIPLACAPVNNGWFEQLDGFLMQPFVYNDAKNSPNNAGDKRRIYMDPDGTVRYAPVQEGWKEALKYLNRLYSEGLISTEAFTMTKEELRSLVEFEGAELVGSLPSGGPHEFANTAGERRKNFVVLPPLEGPDGTRQAYWEEYAGVTIGKWVVPSVSEKKDLAVKLADYLYSEEMQLWGRYGVEGRDWKRPAPGTKAWDGGQAQIEVISGLKWGEPQNVYLANRYPTWGRFASHAMIDTGDPFHLEKVLWDAKNAYEPYKTEKHVPPLFYTDEEARQYNEIINALHPYIELSIAEFVTGARNIDSGWDAYVQECERIGYKTMMEIVQRAFDRQWAETWKANHGK